MQALDMPANGFLFLHAAGPVKIRAAEEVVEADPVRNERDSGQECDQQGDQDGSEQEFHGFHQSAFCWSP